MSPTILLVPGFWEGPSVYKEVETLLQNAGFATETASLVSTGRKPPNSPTMEDDISSIRKHVSKLIEAGKEVVLVVHSISGLLGPNAIEGLEASKRKANGGTGGVIHIVFLAAGVAPERFEHTAPEFIQDNGDGGMICVNPEENLFHDVPDKAKWLSILQSQPTGWDGTVTYCGWRHVPSTYVVAKNDKLIPVAVQTKLAQLAGSEIKELDVGHMLMLVKPEEVADIVKTAAQKVVG